MSGPARFSAFDALCLAGVVLVWGLNFVVMKLGLQGLSPMLLGALRYVVAALPILLLVRRPVVPARYVVLYGLVQGVGQFGLLFTALELGMPAGMASVVMQTQALFTLLLAVPLLGETARPAQWAGLAVAAAGLGCIAAAQGEGAAQMTLLGFVLTLGAAAMWAVSNLVVRRAGQVAPGYDAFAFVVWSSLVPILPFCLLAAAHDGGPAVAAMLSTAGLREWLSVLFLGLGATLLAYTLWTLLLKRHGASRIAPFSLLVPVIGLATAGLVFSESPSPLQWLGVGLILLGLVVNQLGARPARALSSGTELAHNKHGC